MVQSWLDALLGAGIAILGAGAAALFGHIVRRRPLRPKLDIYKPTIELRGSGEFGDGPTSARIMFRLRNNSHNAAAPCVLSAHLITRRGAEELPWAYDPVNHRLDLGTPPELAGAISQGRDADLAEFQHSFPIKPGDKLEVSLEQAPDSDLMERQSGLLLLRIDTPAGRFRRLIHLDTEAERPKTVRWFHIYRWFAAYLLSIRRVPDAWDDNPTV